MIRVVIADDHAIVRKGVRQVVADHPEIEVVAECADYAQIMQTLRSVECDVLLLDITLPGKNGLDALKIVKELKPKLQVLIVSMYTEDQYAVRAMRSGASGYLNKDNAAERLVDAIQTLARGRRYITPELAEFLATAVSQPSDEQLPHQRLSDREFQTIRLIASGKKLSEIAEEMAISPKTVSVYRARIMEKMGLKNNVELTQYAMKNGLID